jgi:hypothetical protein
MSIDLHPEDRENLNSLFQCEVSDPSVHRTITDALRVLFRQNRSHIRQIISPVNDRRDIARHEASHWLVFEALEIKATEAVVNQYRTRFPKSFRDQQASPMEIKFYGDGSILPQSGKLPSKKPIERAVLHIAGIAGQISKGSIVRQLQNEQKIRQPDIVSLRADLHDLLVEYPSLAHSLDATDNETQITELSLLLYQFVSNLFRDVRVKKVLHGVTILLEQQQCIMAPDSETIDLEHELLVHQNIQKSDTKQAIATIRAGIDELITDLASRENEDD